MKAVVAAFNQEKALVFNVLLRAYEPSDGTFSSTTALPAPAAALFDANIHHTTYF